MLYVNDEHGTRAEWYIGQKYKRIDLGIVILAIADGDELEYIIKHFANIPMNHYKPVVRWRGDIAQFIWDNI